MGAHAMFKPYRVSDHTPSVLCIPTLGKAKPKPFKFFNVLTTHELFLDVVKTEWDHYICGFFMFRVVKKLKNLKKPLRKLLYDKCNVHANVNKLRTDLDAIQTVLDADPFNVVLREREATCVIEFNEAMLTKEPVKSHVSRSRIDTVTNSEGVVFDNNTFHVAFVEHYEMFLGQEATFFKEAWNIIANDVYLAVSEFFRNGTLLKEINHTIIALLHKMVSRIMKCVTSTSYSIYVNGSLHGYFKGKRGLRQGDPISPYLFTLVMEVLTLMLQRKVHQTDQFTYHRYCSKIELVNLCFADDLFLFAYGDVGSASIIKEPLDEFKNASGLVPSLPKSMPYFCNVLNHVKLSILHILPFEEGKLLVKYLGVPLVSLRLMIRDCNELVDKVLSMDAVCPYQFTRDLSMSLNTVVELI
nr:hypothetical protein [Tanacetum cinerariifolium]